MSTLYLDPAASCSSCGWGGSRADLKADERAGVVCPACSRPEGLRVAVPLASDLAVIETALHTDPGPPICTVTPVHPPLVIDPDPDAGHWVIYGLDASSPRGETGVREIALALLGSPDTYRPPR
jgi:hypothetical protein